MDEQTIAAIYQAYTSGAMSPEEKADYESDIQSGAMQAPAGATLPAQQAATPTAPAAQELDKGILDAYKSGAMSRDDKMQLEEDIATGVWALPEGEQIGKTEELGFFGKIQEQFTGAERTTPEIEGVDEWTRMPEMNTFSMASFKSALGTMMTNPEESVQVIKANYPGVEVRQDDKGNYILKSSIDGKEYGIQPGAQISDIPRVGGAMAAFTPAGRATSLAGQVIGAGATQAAIEASQAATGGEFDPEQVPLAGLAGGGGFLAGKALAAGAGRAYERFRGPAAVEARPVAPAAAPMATTELAETARKAAAPGVVATEAKKVLAEQAMPDPKAMEAAQRLGIDEYLQPDHVSTNQAFRELSQAVKSIPGSQARAAELQGLEQVAKRADNLIDELGGMQDLSLMDKTVKARLQSIQGELDATTNKLWKEVSGNITPKTPAPANNLLKFLQTKADEFGGVEFLSKEEQSLLKKLDPATNPTYARLDEIRKSLTLARVKQDGEFRNAETGLIKKLESELLKDQKVVAESAGQLEPFNAARQSTAVRKGVEDDMKALFGRDLQKSIIGDLSLSVKKLAAGDVVKFVKMVKAVPEDMRKDVVASGLNTAFGKTAKNGQLSFTNYAKWYEGLLKNKQAHAALMTNLPAAARKQLSDLYRVSNGIRKATRERITTGRIQAVREELRGADTLMGNIFDLAKRSAVGAAAEVVTTPVGLPGAGVAAGISSALTRGKTDALKAADELIVSPAFTEMAKQGTEDAVTRLAATPVWKKFFAALGSPRELTSPEQWILKAFQAERQMQENK